jgi:hypothetical protein
MNKLLSGRYVSKILALACLFSLSSASSFRNKIAKNTETKKYFGVLLSVSASSADMTFAVITKEPNGAKSHRHISKQEFTYIAQGKWKLPPNMKQENLFDKYQIEWGYNERNHIHCPILDSLWKIRYPTLPYSRGSKGWANGQFMPSEKQLIYLWENFGLYNINVHFIEDENFWKLLQLIDSPQWKQMYRNL